MNYLAHLQLAQPTAFSWVGNLMGDFVKGTDVAALPLAVQAGIDNHRAVDRFTDSHDQVAGMKALFSSRRRRFAPVALDMLFDHFLIHHWQKFHDVPLDRFLGAAQQALAEHQPLMPARMQRVTTLMIRDNWIMSYRELTMLGHALDRVAGRIRFANDFAGAIEDIERHYEQLEAGFLVFFPELMSHVTRLALEQPSSWQAPPAGK